MKNLFIKLFVIAMLLNLTGCGYNKFQSLDEEANASWSEVLNQYQRRADLVPNLVETVKGYAAHEKEVFTEVTNARAKVGSMQMTPEMLSDPAAMQAFQAAQGQMTSALSRLMLVAENYPNLKADQVFRDFKVQLEGTENRVTVARNRYIATVKDYNVHARSFPSNITAMIFGYEPKANFSVANEQEISKSPKVDF